MNIPVNSCTTFVQIWVDTNALQNGSTRGVYLVDNRLNDGSGNEGTPNLATNVTNGTNICWQVFNIDPNSTVELDIQSISNASVFGASGQPEAVGDGSGAFTGQVQAAGSASYTINFTAQSGSGISTNVTPSLVVH